jgi:hypothetical protein
MQMFFGSCRCLTLLWSEPILDDNSGRQISGLCLPQFCATVTVFILLEVHILLPFLGTFVVGRHYLVDLFELDRQ